MRKGGKMELKVLNEYDYNRSYRNMSWAAVCDHMGIEWTSELDQKWGYFLEDHPASDSYDDEYAFYLKVLVPLQTKLGRYLKGL